MVRFPLIISEYKALPKDQALANCIQSLLSKNAIERVENVKSLGFYSRTLYRCLKRRLGHSLRTKFYPRSVVSPGKRPSHKRPRIESYLSGHDTLQRPVSGPNSASCNGQRNCGCLHKQTRGNTLSGDVCTPVENHDLVPSLSHNIECQAQILLSSTIPHWEHVHGRDHPLLSNPPLRKCVTECPPLRTWKRSSSPLSSPTGDMYN